MNIVIIGTGNTATVLGKLLFRAGHSIVQVFGRRLSESERLSKMIQASFINDGSKIDLSADIFIVAVSDNAMKEVASWLQVDKKLVVHTAGSISKDVLNSCSKNYGVLYPLQSLRKELQELPLIPFLVDGNTADNCSLVSDLAKTISETVIVASDQQRLMTHVAAVFVSNFTNHLYVLAEHFCKSENIDFKILHPLLMEVARRVGNFSPAQVQTGPAIRNDDVTIQKHLEVLSSFPNQQSLYKILADSIRSVARDSE